MPDISSLQTWRIEGAETDANVPRVQAHPMFARAARTIAVNTLASGERDKTLASIAKDAGRYVVAMWSMYLHVSGGLTLPRLKEICAASGFLSPGRARAMLLFMRYLGYVTPQGRAHHGTPQHYVPTESFRVAWRGHLRSVLEAAATIEPAVQSVIDNLGDDRVMDCVSRRQGEGLLSLTKVRDRETSLIRIFMHRHAGNNMLFTLVAAGDDADFPPPGPIPFSISRFAERFDVSRIHVRRILDAAVAEDFFVLSADGAVTFTVKARAELRASYAMQLSQLLASAADAAADLPPRTNELLVAAS